MHTYKLKTLEIITVKHECFAHSALLRIAFCDLPLLLVHLLWVHCAVHLSAQKF